MSKSIWHARTGVAHIPETFAGLAAGIALLALIGWWSGMQILAGGWSGYVPTAPSTALGLVLLSGALFCFARWPGLQISRLFYLMATSIVFLMGLAVLGQFLFGINPGLEQILSGPTRFLGSTPLGRMSPISAAAFLMESTALFLSITKRWQPASASAVLLAAGASGFNVAVLVGYAFGVPLLYGGTIIPVALPTACAFVLLGVGEFILASPGVPALRDWSGTSMRGILLRAFLPVILFYVVFDDWFDTQFSHLLVLNPAVWDSLKALSAGVLVIIVIGWIAQRTGIEIERAQKALAESEKRFRALIENSSDAVTLLDTDGTVLYDSPAAPGMLGYGPEELIGLNGFTLIHPDDLSRIQDLFQTLAGTPDGRVSDIFRLRHKSGAWLWVEAVATNLLAEPAVKAIVLNYRDVTGRIAAQEALYESNERYRLLMETLPDGVVVHSGGQIVFANAASAAIIGATSAAEFIGKPVIEFVLPDYREMALKRIRESLSSDIPLAVAEEKFVRVDGTAIDVEVAAIPFSYAGKPAMLTVFNDITLRKQAQEALRESEEKFRNTIQEAGEGIVICDEQFRIVEWNKSQETIYALPRAQMLGTLLWDFQYSLLPAEMKTDEAYQRLKRTMLTIWQSDNTAWMNRAAELQLVNAAGERKTILHTPFSITTGRGTLYASLSADITDRKLAEEKIRRQLKYVTALSEIDRAISSGFDLQLSLDTLLVHVIAQLHVDAADILLFDAGSHTLEYAAGQGFRAQAIKNIPIPLSKGPAAHAILNEHPVFISDLEKEPDETPRSAFFVNENFVSYYAVPLRAKSELNGVLEVFQRSRLEPDQEWLVFLNTIAGQAGIAIDNTTLFKSLERSNLELSLAYDATIEGWSHALDLRDKETEGHALRVTEMALELARSFNLTPDELTQVRRGALLHDIGKMGVPDGILLKTSPLTDEEWVIMKKHPVFAYEMLAPIGYLRGALDIPYCHHEKWDGSGYPRGLKGEQIPLAARIFAVVDVWDALRSDRPYRPAWPAKKVQDHIRSLAGTHFDPRVVDLFLKSSIFIRFK